MENKDDSSQKTNLSRAFVNWYNDPQRMFTFSIPEKSINLDSSKNDRIQSETYKNCKFFSFTKYYSMVYNLIGNKKYSKIYF